MDRGFRCHCAAQPAAKPRVGCPSWETVPWPDLSTLFPGSLPVGKTRALRRLNIILPSLALLGSATGAASRTDGSRWKGAGSGVKSGVLPWGRVADSYSDAFNVATGIPDSTALRRVFCALRRTRETGGQSRWACWQPRGPPHHGARTSFESGISLRSGSGLTWRPLRRSYCCSCVSYPNSIKDRMPGPSVSHRSDLSYLRSDRP